MLAGASFQSVQPMVWNRYFAKSGFDREGFYGNRTLVNISVRHGDNIEARGFSTECRERGNE
ncbi:MAG TPA: hypothetical protein DDW45_04740 [Gammaproteobacteria bacterium]|nr:hypothetical protein [Gammaproteobacteria bacterium]